MNVECFFDTNVLVYEASTSAEDVRKRNTALDLIRTKDFGLSAQVLQEFYVTVTRKFRVPLEPPAATALLESYRALPLALIDYPLITSGIEVSLRYGISYWDGAIVAAAESLGAAALFTEDLGHGQRYGSIRVVNPFR